MNLTQVCDSQNLMAARTDGILLDAEEKRNEEEIFIQCQWNLRKFLSNEYGMGDPFQILLG